MVSYHLNTNQLETGSRSLKGTAVYIYNSLLKVDTNHPNNAYRHHFPNTYLIQFSYFSHYR